VECERIGHGQDPKLDRVAYDCVAVTSDLPTIDDSPVGVIGHPFRAVIHFSTGRFTWCRVSGRPNEGDLASRALVAVPAPALCRYPRVEGVDPDVRSWSTVASEAEMSYTVGQLAALAGVTVRTLHHYDRIGLLEPEDRSGSASYRRYGPASVERLLPDPLLP
jgi:hypothetical protein